MRAIVLTAPGEVELTDDWTEPVAGPHEVVVAVRGVGLCGSDLAVFDGTAPVPSWPWVMGHEGGGEIVAVGEAVKDRAVGERVVIEPNYACGACPDCRAGATSACPQRRIVGMTEPGLLRERVAVPAAFAHPVPATVADEQVVCLEPLAVAGSAVRRAGVRAADRCLVIGAGSQGLLVCQTLLALGAVPSVVEPHEGRLALARELGAEDAAPSDTYPFVFNTTDAASAWELAVASTARRGTLAMIGIGVEPVRLSTRELVRRQLQIRGMLIYDHPHDFRATIDTVVDGALRPERVLQSASGPADAAAAFAQARAVPGKSWISLAAWHDGALAAIAGTEPS